MILLTWNPPPNVSDCQITYFITYDGDGIHEAETFENSTSFIVTFLPCYVTSIKVWPVSSSGRLGALATIDVEPRT